MKSMLTILATLAMVTFAAGPALADCGSCSADHAEAQKTSDGGACCPAMKGDEVADKSTRAKLGEKAPNFELTDAKGEKHQLSDFKGKVIVLAWTNPDCPYIVRHNEAQTLEKLAEAYNDKDVVVLNIDSTRSATVERTKETAEEYDLTLPVLHDTSGAVGRMYDAKTTPHLYVIDKEGKLVYQGAIDNDPRGRLSAEEKVNYVAEALDAVLAGKEVKTPSTKPYGCSVKYAPKKDKGSDKVAAN